MKGVFLSLKIGGSFDPNFPLGAVLGILEPGCYVEWTIVWELPREAFGAVPSSGCRTWSFYVEYLSITLTKANP